MRTHRDSCTDLSTASVNNPNPRFVCFRRTVRSVSLLVSLGFPLLALAASAADYLRFDQVPDGRCQILSQGGKLTLLSNTHPTKAIRYRLERLFVERPQGLMDGVIRGADGAQKLGCDTVGGRAQQWRIKRATFAPE